MADVLLSLKHAVLRASPDPQQMQSQTQNYNHPQAALSYTVHPQILVSPSHQSQSQNNNYTSMGYYDNQCNGQHVPPPPPIYPSMSVNVSMNMTMHGYGAEGSVPVQCSQVIRHLICFLWSPYCFPIAKQQNCNLVFLFILSILVCLFSLPFVWFRCNGHRKIHRHPWTCYIRRHCWARIIIPMVPRIHLRPIFAHHRPPHSQWAPFWIQLRYHRRHRSETIIKIICRIRRQSVRRLCTIITSWGRPRIAEWPHSGSILKMRTVPTVWTAMRNQTCVGFVVRHMLGQAHWKHICERIRGNGRSGIYTRIVCFLSVDNEIGLIYIFNN